jgi:hypothetical protein
MKLQPQNFSLFFLDMSDFIFRLFRMLLIISLLVSAAAGIGTSIEWLSNPAREIPRKSQGNKAISSP